MNKKDLIRMAKLIYGQSNLTEKGETLLADFQINHDCQFFRKEI